MPFETFHFSSNPLSGFQPSQQATMASLFTSSIKTTLISSPSSTSTTLLQDIKQEEVDYDTDIDIHTIVKKLTMPRTPYKPRMAHIYAVMVKEDGTILPQNGTGPPQVLPLVWVQGDMESFYLACLKFERVEKKRDFPSFWLASFNLGTP
jgi:hypothetical protein